MYGLMALGWMCGKGGLHDKALDGRGSSYIHICGFLLLAWDWLEVCLFLGWVYADLGRGQVIAKYIDVLMSLCCMGMDGWIGVFVWLLDWRFW